jgi:hypothetical protein
MLRDHGLPLEELEADYPFVRLGDLISLAFCTGWTEAQRVGDWTVQLAGIRVAVSPDIFDGATIPIEIAARDVRGRTFRSDFALRDAVREAPTTTLRGEVAGGP